MIGKRVKKQAKIALPIIGIVMMVFSSVVSVLVTQSTYAADCTYDQSFYETNDILYYNPCDTESTCSSTGITLGTVSDVAKAKLDAEGIAEKAAANKEIYDYAAEKTGVPWQILAALHYREAKMDPTKSIGDGSSLTAGVSKDGLVIYADAKEDAANKAAVFVKNAAGVYSLNIDTVSSWSVDDWGNAFLAYNRGHMYKVVDQSYTLSPYVMNYIDSDHENMAWTYADSYYNGAKLNGLYDAGQKDSNVGALTVANYLGFTALSGDEATEAGSGNCGGSGAVYNSIVETAIEFSWPNTPAKGGRSVSEAKQSYLDAMNEAGTIKWGCHKLGDVGADCSIFVTTVMLITGADPDFPAGTRNEVTYLANATDKYERIENIHSTSNLQPGDIAVLNGHVAMYVGDVATDGGSNVAQASCDMYTPHRGYSMSMIFVDPSGRGEYAIYRLK